MLWFEIAAPSQFLNFRRGDLGRVRLGKGGEGEAVYLFRSRLDCLVEISSVFVHLKIFIAATVTKSCMVKTT